LRVPPRLKAVSKEISQFGDYIPEMRPHNVETVTGRGLARPVLIKTPSERASHPAWFALQVRPDRERQVTQRLNGLGLESYLPTYEDTLRWSDRTKRVTRPLFAGYVFVRLDRARIPDVLQVPFIYQLLPTNLNPTPIPDHELASLRLAIASGLPAAPCVLAAGAEVTIGSGPLAGVSGVVVQAAGQTRVVVGIEMLGRAVSVAIDAADLRRNS